MYKVELNTAKKLLIVSASGLVNKDEGEKIYQDVTQNIRKINPSEYSLVCETSDLKASTQDSLPVMEKLMGAYLNTAFKARYCLVSKNVVTNMQLKRVGQDGFMKGFTTISSLDEVK